MIAETGSSNRSELRRDVVRAQIQERAAALFSERGFAATTLQDIASAVGMTRPALYHYLESKDALLSDIAHDLIAGVGEDLGVISGNAGMAPPQRLRLLIDRIVRERLARPHRYLLFVRAGRDLPEPIQAAYVQAQAEVVSQLEGVLAAGVAAGDFRDHDTATSAHTLFGMASWVVWWAAGTVPDAHAVIAAGIADLALASVGPAEPPGGGSADITPRVTQEMIVDLRRVLHRLEASAAARKEPT